MTIFMILLFCVWAIPASSFAATIHVPANEPTIQAGIDAATAGDIVLVADGIFRGLGNRDLDFNGKAVTVCSENGPKYTVIDCERKGRGFLFRNNETRATVVAGLTITNGYANYGGAVRCNSSPTILNCRIIANQAEESGGGIFCTLQGCRIENCEIVHNYAYRGGGIYISHAAAEIINCTIIGNSSEIFGGIYTIFDYQYTPFIINSILWDNISVKGENYQLYSTYNFNNNLYRGNFILSYSNIDQDGFDNEGKHNIRQNPMFEDTQQGNFNLSIGSPCIDKGMTFTHHATDLKGNYRVFDGDGDGIAVADMGAYEYGSFQIVRGDLNSSMSVDLGDALLALRILNGIQPLGGFNPIAARLGTHKRLKLEDAVYILQVMTKLR
jgi:predicted outer membrane repeat protein